MRISWDRVGGRRTVLDSKAGKRQVKSKGVGSSVTHTRWEGKNSDSFTVKRRSAVGDQRSDRVKLRSVARTEGRISRSGGVDMGLAKGGFRKSFAEVVKGAVKEPVVATRKVGGLAGSLKEPVEEGVLSSAYVKLRRFPFKPRNAFMKEGSPAVRFSISEMELGKEKFGNSVVMRFQTGRPPPAAIKKMILHGWKVYGSFSFSEILDEEHVLVKFELERDLLAALAYPGRSIGASVFRLFKWRIDYDPLHFQKRNKIWIQLPNLPVFLFDGAFVKVIVSSFAKLIKLDDGSKNCMNLKCMRVCVELLRTTPIPAKVWIELPHGRSYWQEVRVEGHWCSVCRTVGHSSGDCAEVGFGLRNEKTLVENPDGNMAHVTPNFVDAESEFCRDEEGLIPVAADEERSMQPAHINIFDDSSNFRQFEDDNHRHQVSHSEMSNCVAECHNEDGKSGEGARESICVAETRMEDGNSGMDNGQNELIQAAAIGSQSEPQTVRPTEATNQWQLVPHSKNKKKKKRVASYTKDTALSLKSPCDFSDMGLDSFNGNLSVAKDVVGQCTSLDFSTTCAMQSQSPLAMCKDSSKNQIVSPGNKMSNHVISTAITKDSFDKALGSTSSHGVHLDPATPIRACNPISLTVGSNPSCNIGAHANPASSLTVTHAVPCDSLELLRKKVDLQKMAYVQKLASYGSSIFGYQEDGQLEYLDAKDFYLRLKANRMDPDRIFQIMDEYFAFLQAREDGPNSPIGTDEDSVDLSRILKHPRRKTKGSRKKDSEYV